MGENDERSSNRLNMIDQMYGYEQPIEEEEEQQKSIAQQMIDAIQQRRQNAFRGMKSSI
jgi:hypothetical protein